MNLLKELHKRILSLIILCLFLISTSGVVLFYHFCQHSNQMLYSVFIDETEDMCAENALICETPHQHHNHCCQQESKTFLSKDESCCQHHQSFYKTIKLNTTYLIAKKLSSPKSTQLSLLFSTYLINSERDANQELQGKALLRNFPPSSTIFKLSGRDIVTFHHSLKIYA
jgi:hypothetical protein